MPRVCDGAALEKAHDTRVKRQDPCGLGDRHEPVARSVSSHPALLHHLNPGAKLKKGRVIGVSREGPETASTDDTE